MRVGAVLVLGLVMAGALIYERGWGPELTAWLQQRAGWISTRTAAPAQTAPLRKCLPPPQSAASAPLYTNEPCPAGWRAEVVPPGAVTVVPLPAPAASLPALPLGPKAREAEPTLQERALERATQS